MASFRFTLFLSLVTLLGMCARTDALCPPDWEPDQVPGTTYCYRIFNPTVAKTWLQAESYCDESHTADLVSIHSLSEAIKVYDIFQSENPGRDDRMWIGLNKPVGAVDYEWSDGSTRHYTRWTNEPPQGSAPSAVVLIPPGNGADSSKWEVSTATEQGYLMCKKPAQNTP
ncbi:Snaclec 7 [Holothuria leucospilota]|uniref:Snaclec 7 n=1 Tax=Holothuria leucospilota TaxID=206669 RepID=A0A9Q0YI50_HOLLE|nr:Snaclec 7 [Holothuria leucospilota]